MGENSNEIGEGVEEIGAGAIIPPARSMGKGG